jgi:hypothetical protein
MACVIFASRPGVVGFVRVDEPGTWQHLIAEPRQLVVTPRGNDLRCDDVVVEDGFPLGRKWIEQAWRARRSLSTRTVVDTALAPNRDILPQITTYPVTDTYEQIMVSLRNGSKLAALPNEG